MQTTCIALLAIALPACSPVGPDYPGAPEVEHDERFANATGSRSAPTLDRWWRRLRDPKLNRYVDEVLEHNLDLRITQQRLREARALRRQAGAAFLPQGTGSLSFTRLDLGRGGGGISGELTGTGFFTDPLEYWSTGLDVSWEIDVFGGRRREARAATARTQAAREALHAARLAIVSETVEAFCTLAGLQAQLAQVHNQVRGQESQLADLKDREAAGAVSKLDLDRARARLEQTRSQAPTLRAGIEAQRRRLLVLHGTARSDRVSPTARLPRKLPMVRTGLPAALVARRPDLRQAERELAAATEDIGVATATLYPRFSLLGSPSTSTRTFGDLFDAVNYDWQVGPGVSWSLFSGGRNRALVEAANARQRQALARYEKAVIGALNEVETELAALRNETERLTIVQRVRQATAQSVKRVRESHRDGALDYFEVLIEEERLREAELAELRVKSQLLLVWTRFHKALGGGWK